ncbi:MAG: acetyl-CoA carboxylase biotin carboxyl carrier protein [Bacteroidales bacterium]|nr:acetyl-CoA carboxylase biotin carboxyl carrier protein [Bacteroidales bacterium]
MANLKEIQEFLENLAKTDLHKVEIKTDEIELKVQLKPKISVTSVSTPTIQQPVYQHSPEQVTHQNTVNTDTKTPERNNFLSIKSPIVGTFYRKPNPESPTFVEVGQKINKGDVVCIVEAMKLFNEIEAEISGEITEILVEDGQPVEFDQPLFLVKP